MTLIETDKKIIVIYHANCYDGVTAAYVAWLRFKDSAEYLPFNYSDAPPEVKGKEIYIVDFSFKRDVIKHLQEYNLVTVLDHHKTAQAELEDLPSVVFDMERSGAGITWDYFFGDNNNVTHRSYNRPELVNYIEDRDLWRFKLPSSREVNAWIQSWDIDLEVWKRSVVPIMEVRTLSDIVIEGAALLRQQSKLVKSICYNASLARTPGEGKYIGPYVETSILMSEVCEQMLADYPEYPFSWYSFVRRDGKRQYGLRSRNTEDFDVSVIAKSFGGGGHKNAAGFELEVGSTMQAAPKVIV